MEACFQGGVADARVACVQKTVNLGHLSLYVVDICFSAVVQVFQTTDMEDRDES